MVALKSSIRDSLSELGDLEVDEADQRVPLLLTRWTVYCPSKGDEGGDYETTSRP